MPFTTITTWNIPIFVNAPVPTPTPLPNISGIGNIFTDLYNTLDVVTGNQVINREVKPSSQEQLLIRSKYKLKFGNYIKALDTFYAEESGPGRQYEAITNGLKYIVHKYEDHYGQLYVIVIDNMKKKYYLHEDQLVPCSRIERKLPIWF